MADGNIPIVEQVNLGDNDTELVQQVSQQLSSLNKNVGLIYESVNEMSPREQRVQKKLRGEQDKERIAPRRRQLLDEGVEGSSAVYIGEKLEQMQEGEEEQKKGLLGS